MGTSPYFLFQSPSLRGSGRFEVRGIAFPNTWTSFNPLHCGAVVASLRFLPCRRFPLRTFQSPSLRGSGRFDEAARRG